MHKNLNLTNIDKICKKKVAKKICKSILGVYNLLPLITNSLDKLILKKAENSMVLGIGESVEHYSKEMIELGEQKVSLINLKVLLDESLSQMKESDARIVILRFVDGVKCDDCLEILKVDKRTFFRRLSGALESFCKIFNFKLMQGRIRQGILGQELMEDIFLRLDKFVENGGNLEENKECICGLILNKMRKVCR